MKKHFFTLIALAIFAISCGGSSTQEKKPQNREMFGQATGYGTIFDNDVALAKDRAVDDAMATLVKSKLGTTIQSQQLVKDFQLVESLVKASSTGMVKNWQILKTSKDGNTLVVTIEGEVFPQAVNDTIKATLDNYGKPKFMILVKERFEFTYPKSEMSLTELVMTEIMGAAGFEFVDPQVTAQILSKERSKMNQIQRGKVSDSSQSILLNDYGAEVIILADVRTQDQSAAIKKIRKDWVSKRAFVNLKALDIYTGRILATKAADAAAADISAEAAARKAITNCLKSLKVLGAEDEMGVFQSGDFMNQITRKFLEAATKRQITLSISGLNPDGVTKFRSALKERIRGVKDVTPKAQSKGFAKLDLEFAGKTNDFADELRAKASNIGFSVEIEEIYPNRIIMKVEKK